MRIQVMLQNMTSVKMQNPIDEGMRYTYPTLQLISLRLSYTNHTEATRGQDMLT